MSTCEYRKRPSAEQVCHVMPMVGKKMCPRHEFLFGEEQRKRDAKAAAAALKQRNAGRVPVNRRQLQEFGYQLGGTGKCSGCGRHIEWWRTPNDKRMPYDPMPEEDSRPVSHFATCPCAKSFRRAG